MARKKASTVQKISTSDAIKRMEDKVEQSKADLSVFWDTADNLISKMRKSTTDKAKAHGESICSSELDNRTWASAFYKEARKHKGNLDNDARAILYYLWRLADEFPGIAAKCQDTIADDFGIKGKNGLVPDSLLKKLNAQKHRPLCVSESYMAGVPVSRDSDVASLYSTLLADEYTDKVENIDAFVVAHWDELKDMTSVAQMREKWIAQNGTPPHVEKRHAENVREDRITTWVDGIKHGKKGKTLLDLAGASIKADDKDVIRTEGLNALSQLHGVGVIRVSSVLYAIAQLQPKTDYAKDGKPTVDFPLDHATNDQLDKAIASAKSIMEALERAKYDLAVKNANDVIKQAMAVVESLPADQRKEVLAQFNGQTEKAK